MDEQFIEKCVQAGFDDTFTVPISQDELQTKIIDKILFVKHILENEIKKQNSIINRTALAAIEEVTQDDN